MREWGKLWKLRCEIDIDFIIPKFQWVHESNMMREQSAAEADLQKWKYIFFFGRKFGKLNSIPLSIESFFNAEIFYSKLVLALDTRNRKVFLRLTATKKLSKHFFFWQSKGETFSTNLDVFNRISSNRLKIKVAGTRDITKINFPFFSWNNLKIFVRFRIFLITLICFFTPVSTV